MPINLEVQYNLTVTIERWPAFENAGHPLEHHIGVPTQSVGTREKRQMWTSADHVNAERTIRESPDRTSIPRVVLLAAA